MHHPHLGAAAQQDGWERVQGDVSMLNIHKRITGLAAATLSREEGADLRSRCQLFPMEAFVWQLLDTPGTEPKTYTINGPAAVKLLGEAISEAEKIGLPWESEITLTPHPDLVSLVKKSQVLSAHQTVGED